MKKKALAMLLSLSMMSSFMVPAFAAEPDSGASTEEAVYLGVEGYGTVTKEEKANFKHKFSVDGEVKTYTVENDGITFAIENTLQEGYIYDITVENGTVTAVELLDKGSDNVVMGEVTALGEGTMTVEGEPLTVADDVKTYEITTAAGGASVEEAALAEGDSVKVIVDGDAAKTIYKTFVAEEYTAPVSGTPGLKTLKNFLATAMEPVGTSLYVFGGAWDWQDDKSSNQAMSIGLPQSWVDFFQSQDENYSYKTSADPAHSYYPHNSWNQYYYAGPDCSGYVGWAAYNLMNTEDSVKGESDGYVMSSTKMARTFAETNHWGTWERTTENGFKVGDVFSMSGHVWICLGTCDDGSIVFMHSTPSDSKAGQGGGGVQISALDPNGSKSCEAYQLADHYMKAYYPGWSERYEPVLRDYNSYTAIASNANAGKFSWDLNGEITDPDGYADMTPAQILADLFGEELPVEPVEAVYLGIKDFANSHGKDKDNFEYLFSVNGATETYKVANDEHYSIQNQLMEGYIYNITVEDGTVTAVELLDKGSDSVMMGEVTALGEGTMTVDGKTLTVADGVKTYEITTAAGGASVEEAAVAVGDSVKVIVKGDAAETIYKAFVAEEYKAPVSGTPGRKTLKNFLATAMEPVGTSLYVYGGTWDWQDDKSSNQAMTIGLPQSWIDFFQSHDETYTYRNDDDPAHSYYWRHYNEYYYGGPDCSGYAGWVLYNLMNTESSTVSENEGFVGSATSQAGKLADRGWGTMDMGDELLNEDGTPWVDKDGVHRGYDGHDFKTGDVFSMNGHVWICVGTCDDGSIVFLHSTPNTTNGAGAQISAIGPDKNCEAYQLANYYMNKYYPAWSERYGDQVLCLTFDGYTRVYGSTAGKFSWDLNGEITDPDGYADMTPAQILADLFGEETPSSGGSSSSSGKKDEGKAFTDVNKGDWYYDAVMEAAEKGIMDGVTDKRFDPNGQITRAMLAQILYSQNGKPAADKDGTLVDVPASAWYADAMYWAKAAGAMVGYGDGRMGPTDLLTREQLAVVLYSYAKENGINVSKQSDLTKYSDSEQVADWAQDAMSWAVGAGLISGRTTAILAPNGTATRAEVAQIMVHFLKISK